MADTATRAGVAERCAAPAVHKRLEVALARITSEDARLRDVARTLRTTAKHHDANPRSRRPTVPGLGQMRSLGRLSASHRIARVPRGQAVRSSGRLGKGAQAANGNRSGTAGAKIGQAQRTWACADAAVVF